MSDAFRCRKCGESSFSPYYFRTKDLCLKCFAAMTDAEKAAVAAQSPSTPVESPPIARRKKKSDLSFYWPRVDTIDAAKKASRQGFWACVWVIGVTTLFIVLGIAGVRIVGAPDYRSFLDVAVFAVIALGIWRFSRIAACCGLAAYLAERLATPFYSGAAIMIVIFTLMFVNGIRGAWAYHRFRLGAPSPASGQPIEPA